MYPYIYIYTSERGAYLEVKVLDSLVLQGQRRWWWRAVVWQGSAGEGRWWGGTGGERERERD